LELDNNTTFYEVRSCLQPNVKQVVFKHEFNSTELTSAGRKRITVSVVLDLGPNPTSDQIQASLKQCSEACQKNLKAKVL